MCLLSFCWKQHPRYKLVLIANRDEFYARPTKEMYYWEDHPSVLAGRDLEAGGTWMGTNQKGFFTALTNFRDPQNIKKEAPSRGQLTADFLINSPDPRAYLEELKIRAAEYNGFNLLVGTADELYYYSNYAPEIQALRPGLYGLSNHLLDTPWYKVEKLKAAFKEAIQVDDPAHEELLSILHNPTVAPDEQIQQTGLSQDQERMLSSLFIKSKSYGTHSSSILKIDYQNRVWVHERRYSPPATQTQDRHFTWPKEN